MLNHISRTPFLASVNESLQDNASRNEPMIFASYCLIGATLVFGGLGYAADRWLATSPWLTLLGLLVGIALGLFGRVYGRTEPERVVLIRSAGVLIG